MQYYSQQALAPSTRKLYIVGEGHYISFCQLHQQNPLLASEQTLAEFIVYLADVVQCAPCTIKSYMAAVRNLHVEQGIGDPFMNTTLPHHIFRGVQRTIGTHNRRQRLPITLSVLRQLISQLRKHGDCSQALMLAAACSLAFFGFMQSGELLALQRSDIEFIKDGMLVHIRASKTDPFRRGCDIVVGPAAQPDICLLGLVRLHLSKLLSTSAGTDQSLFSLNNQPLGRGKFVEEVQIGLVQSGATNASLYKGHSFQIGAATTAGHAGIPEWLIKTMGRWSSSAYQTYIRTPRSTVAAVAASLFQQ